MKGINICQEHTTNMRKYISKKNYNNCIFCLSIYLLFLCFSFGCVIVFDVTRHSTFVSVKKVLTLYKTSN